MAGKRGNGEGTIIQRDDGSWRGQIRLHGARHSVSGKTRREVQQKLRALAADADRGIAPATERATLADYLAEWLAVDVQHTRKSRTYRNYGDVARLYIIPAIGRVRVAQLQPAHIERLHAAMRAAGLAPKTIRLAHGALHVALQKAVDRGTLPRNVADLVPPPRLVRREIEWFTAEQARHLQAVAGAGRWGPLIATALATGMRQGELLGLRWADADLEHGVIRVARQLTRDGTLEELKSDRHRRGIDIPATTVAILREHKRRQNEERLLAGPDWHDQGLVFTTHAGRPLGWRNVTREYKGLLRKAGLPDRRFHSLRHTNATLLLLQGVHPKVVQERLGHASISITLDIYSHVLPRLGQEAAAKLDALFA